MSIFFDEDKALTPSTNESWSKGPRTDISENFKAVSKAFSMTELTQSEIRNKQEEYGNVVQLLHESGNTNFVDPTDPMNFMVDDIDIAPSVAEMETSFWNQVENAKKNNSELDLKLKEAGYDTQENMQKVIAKKAKDAWSDYASVSERATTSGKIVGGFGGMAVTAFKDPWMQLGVLASFGYSVPATFGSAALRVAYMEAIIGAAAETMIQLKAQPYRKELGFEDAGLERGIKNVFMVAGASAVLSPALLGVFKAFGKGIDVGKKHLFKLSDEKLQQVGKELGDLNPKYKNKDLDNYQIPRKDNPFPDNAAGRTEHRERLDLAVKSFNEGTELDLPPAKNPATNIEPPISFKVGEFQDVFDGQGNLVKTQIVKVSSSGNSAKIKFNDGSEKVITLDPKSSAYQNVRNPNYTIRSAGLGDEIQGKPISKLSKEKLNEIRTKLLERKNLFEADQNRINYQEGAYNDLIQDLNSLDFNPPKITTDTNAPGVNKAEFNRNESKLAEDLNNVKDFDVPTEATYRNQASLDEGSMFDAGTSLAIRSEAGAGAAAKTLPTGNPLAKTQDLLSKSQVTDTAPPSKVLATAQSKPPLLTRGETNKVVGDINSIGKPLYHKTDDFNEIYSTLSKKIDAVKAELQPIATKYNGDLKARVKDKDKIKLKLSVKDLKPQNISDYLGARISVDNITAAKLLFSELDKTYKLIGRDDFLDDIGRTLTHKTQYRRIHLQALTKDGFSFELQISLKELDPLIDASHKIYTGIEYQFDRFWTSKSDFIDKDGINRLLKEQKIINTKIEKKYFEIKDKEFTRFNPTNDVDIPYVVGTRLDEKGEIVPLLTTAREAFEQDAKAQTMFKRLENCV
ncbi:MAG: hypothetical protein CMI81_03760 [Candidatus Pelagibacter sp.]|nr:hypothetical protein [Candidatus Pelagibacter sp.]OUV96602.1 MAG: hypothetical protein CBD02_04770 [Candidatus Pelagibacter sp. TMED142]|tara:strand:+ start:2847 stop:5408 length:2562 start_codon:yes stop_codon:yes gene_type:complete